MISRPRRSIVLAAAALILLIAVIGIGRGIGSFLSPWPDPNSFAGDPRLAACRTVLSNVDHVFEMSHARWFPRYFPGWSEGAPELEVDEPALVVLESPQPGIKGTTPHILESGAPVSPQRTASPMFRMCIAVGPPDGAIVHQYGPTWFEKIVPVLPGT